MRCGGRKFGAEIGGGRGIGGGYFLGGAGGDDAPTVASPSGTHVDDMVGGFHHVEVVFDYQHGVPPVDEPVEDGQEGVDVLEMEAGGRFVENEEGLAGVAFGEFGGEFHALVLSAGKGGGGLSELDVAEAYILKHFDFFQDIGLMLEELYGLIDCHVEDIGDGFPLEAYLEGLAVVAAPSAVFAGDEDIGEEIHLDGLVAVPFAGLASAAGDVEGEAARLVAADFSLGQTYKEIADVGEYSRIGGRIGARSAA